MASKSPANQRAKNARTPSRKKLSAAGVKEIQLSLERAEGAIEDLREAYKAAANFASIYDPGLRGDLDWGDPLEEIKSMISNFDECFLHLSPATVEQDISNIISFLDDRTLISIVGLLNPPISDFIENPAEIFERILSELSSQDKEDNKSEISTLRNLLKRAGYEFTFENLSRSISNVFQTTYKLRKQLLSVREVDEILSEELAALLIEEDSPHLIYVSDVVKMIDAHYQYVPTAYTVKSKSGSILRPAGRSDDECKILAWSKLKGLDPSKVLNIFPTNTNWLVINPSAPRKPSSPSLSSILRSNGWKSLKFDNTPLKKIGKHR